MEEIELKTKFPPTISREEVYKVLDSALRHEADLADARRARFKRICTNFEQQFQMSSEEFMKKFDSGAIGDDAEYFDWYAAKRGLDLWERRFQILSEVKV